MDKIIALKKYSIAYLSKYSSSKKNLERILKNKIRRMSPEKSERFVLYNKINDIINELESKKLINDDIFTETKINNYVILGKSKNFIVNNLLNKGLNRDLIETKINEYEDEFPNWEIEAAKKFAQKKRLGKYGSNLNFSEKDLAKMARAGFNYSISLKILENN